MSVDNDRDGIGRLVARFKELNVSLVVLEATGRYARAAAAALMDDGGFEVAVVNPRQVRDFARATGQLAKTDAIDARVLARFGRCIGPAPARNLRKIRRDCGNWWHGAARWSGCW